MASLQTRILGTVCVSTLVGFGITLGAIVRHPADAASTGLLIGLVSLAINLLIIGLTIRWALKPHAQLADTLHRLANTHDLSLRAPDGGDDETGTMVLDLNAFVAAQQAALRAVQRELEELSLNLHVMTRVTAQLSKDTRTQADYAASSAASIEQITVSVTHIADNSRDASSTAADAQQLSGDSAEAVGRVSEDVGQVSESMQVLSRAMDALSQRADEIFGIVGVINDISGQTNLLALNAAIEAARAGEQGRGFAIVADEVRKLAERTGQATTDIATRIEAVGRETQQALDHMGSTCSRVDRSVERAQTARRHMLEIGDRMTHMVGAINQIAEATREQSGATTSMAQTVERVSGMVQATDSALTQSKQTLESLDKQAERLLALVSQYQLADIEVLHWWLSASEARAVFELKKLLNARGHHWMDANFDHADPMASLKSRVTAGTPPTAAMIGGIKIQHWARQGVCADLTGLAREQGWDKVLPALFNEMIQANSQYVAVPLGVHRTNMLWVNAELARRLGFTRAPADWDSFFAMADKARQAGIPFVAHSNQSWQLSTTFEAITVSLGAEFYRAAFCRLDPAALGGPTMIRAFELLRRLKPYATPDPVGREWNLATADVINGRAVLQVMGDWAKAEFVQAGKTKDNDYLSWPALTPAGDFCFNLDALTFFAQTDPTRHSAQRDFAALLMSPEGQEGFNLYKGGIPARSDVPMGRFDAYARQSMQDFAQAANRNVLLPSWAHNMALLDDTKEAIFHIVDQFWANGTMNAADAARSLAEAARRRS